MNHLRQSTSLGQIVQSIHGVGEWDLGRRTLEITIWHYQDVRSTILLDLSIALHVR